MVFLFFSKFDSRIAGEMLCQLICFILALGIELPRAVIYVITSMCLGEELPSCPGLGFVHIPWAHTLLGEYCKDNMQEYT